MTVKVSTILDAHEGYIEKSPDAKYVFDLVKETGPNEGASSVLDGTMWADGSHVTGEGDYFVYRQCAKTACRAECGMVIETTDEIILDAARFRAPCTGKE